MGTIKPEPFIIIATGDDVGFDSPGFGIQKIPALLTARHQLVYSPCHIDFTGVMALSVESYATI